MYADDVKLFAIIKSGKNCDKLQHDIDNLQRWSNINELSFNVSNCSIISFHRCACPIFYDFKLNNISLTRVTSIKDLGVLLDVKLSSHFEYICSKRSQC